ncbi:hypothetical protein GGR56DRAFT_346186 [Xylariaceae sp. FL0804]|nr:hypothetical protein GGR56DRAFT_346186 [Xylariaceae sp. FL0804]
MSELDMAAQLPDIEDAEVDVGAQLLGIYVARFRVAWAFGSRSRSWMSRPQAWCSIRLELVTRAPSQLSSPSSPSPSDTDHGCHQPPLRPMAIRPMAIRPRRLSRAAAANDPATARAMGSPAETFYSMLSCVGHRKPKVLLLENVHGTPMSGDRQFVFGRALPTPAAGPRSFPTTRSSCRYAQMADLTGGRGPPTFYGNGTLARPTAARAAVGSPSGIRGPRAVIQQCQAREQKR